MIRMIVPERYMRTMEGKFVIGHCNPMGLGLHEPGSAEYNLGAQNCVSPKTTPFDVMKHAAAHAQATLNKAKEVRGRLVGSPPPSTGSSQEAANSHPCVNGLLGEMEATAFQICAALSGIMAELNEITDKLP